MEDLGEDIKSETFRKKANHGLVFMFRSLASSYSQPISMFASNDTVHGKTILKQYILVLLIHKTKF